MSEVNDTDKTAKSQAFTHQNKNITKKIIISVH